MALRVQKVLGGHPRGWRLEAGEEESVLGGLGLGGLGGFGGLGELGGGPGGGVLNGGGVGG